jgi:ABC-type cobalamin transport system permease subunit
MDSRQLIDIVVGAAIGAMLGAGLFDYLDLEPGVLGIGIGAALGALLGGVLGRR